MKLVIFLCLLYPSALLAQSAGFTAPDTVCVNAPVSLQNTSTGAGTYYWNFCSGSVYNPPVLENLGNPGGLLNTPVHTTIAQDGNNYFVFLVNNTDRRLVKLAFGNSLLNAPVATYVPGVQVPLSGEGIQVIKNAQGFHLVIVGGTVAQGSVVMKISFGASLSNPAPVAASWGNVGNLAYPQDLFTFEEGGEQYGFTCNFENHTITRLHFGADLNTAPTGLNLGNFGLLDRPAGLYTIQENGNWYVFVVSERNHKLVRLDFGSSLLNTPVAVDLGNPGGQLQYPRDITFVRECGQTMALVINGSEPHVIPSVNKLVRLDFTGGITGNITATDLGNPGNILRFPVSLSSLVRTENDLFAFVPNVTGNSLARVSFRNCTDASISSSNNAVPPSFSYARPGRYTVNLITDEGTATQGSFCRTIVVVDPPAVNLGIDRVACNGNVIELDAGAGFSRYSWSNGSVAQKITASTTGTYSVTVANGGCSATDEISLSFSPGFSSSATTTMTDCRNTTGTAEVLPSGGLAPYTFQLNGGAPVTSGSFSGLAPGDHSVVITDNLGCETTQQFTITEDAAKLLKAAYTKQDPLCATQTNGSIELQVTQGVPPFEYAIDNGPFGAGSLFTGLGDGTYTVQVRNNNCLVSYTVGIQSPDEIRAELTTENERCERANGSARLSLSGGTQPYEIRWNGNITNSPLISGLSAGSYTVTVTDQNGCGESMDFELENINTERVNIINRDTTINIGDEVVLQAENAPDYRWEPSPGLSCATCAVTVARPVTETQYIVKTVTGLNCISADTVLVKLTYHRNLYMPNAFTPNGDGVNDFFRPKAQGVMVYKMQVFNRWGQLVYQGAEVRRGWDGKLNGAPQPVGVYVYKIDYGFWNNEGSIQMNAEKGTFLLMR